MWTPLRFFCRPPPFYTFPRISGIVFSSRGLFLIDRRGHSRYRKSLPPGMARLFLFCRTGTSAECVPSPLPSRSTTALMQWLVFRSPFYEVSARGFWSQTCNGRLSIISLLLRVDLPDSLFSPLWLLVRSLLRPGVVGGTKEFPFLSSCSTVLSHSFSF